MNLVFWLFGVQKATVTVVVVVVEIFVNNYLKRGAFIMKIVTSVQYKNVGTKPKYKNTFS